MIWASALLLAPWPGQVIAQSSATSEAARTSVAAEIRSSVGGKLRDFYGPRGYWPLWIEKGKVGPQGDALIALMEGADADGLKPGDYDLRALKRLKGDADANGDPKLLARADLAFSKAFAALVSDMRKPSRKVKVRYLDPEVEPKDEEPREILRAAAVVPSFVDYVKDIGWMNPFYVKLRKARTGFAERWSGLPQVALPADVRLRPGMKSGAAPLRRRLGLESGAAYDKVLAAKVKAFQGDHGLKPDGVAGTATIEALNRGDGYYDRLIALNLERARLLPGPYTRHVVVDAASARLWYFSKGAQDGTMKVVVGAKESQTPMMAGMVRYATLNPYWNVPSDLVERKLAPKMLNGASLTKLHYEALSDWSVNAQRLDPANIDWRAVADGRTELRVRQLPGGDNAMGKVKFMFPNDLGIYLHDTPSRDLLAKPARQFSNGCVRLEDAQRLGRWFFGRPLKAESDKPEQHEPLPQPVPVYLTYLTAIASGDGVQFLPDVYGRDVM
ncbi:murein L,D-transpeptidase [Sphingobium sp. LB126]|uniref:L,D-transpeptidase family protein n=1 Tax=Sphingobium sp. LB126 TaxID=1983755 RepID=UPI000C20C771|nr:L,D-transpeptidase family protein [Sphingobium sp. LB126]PJG49362.1 murein L,D-transpeptidase [Sphingobium sp. LB126]